MSKTLCCVILKKRQFWGKICCCTRLKGSLSENVHHLLKGPWMACLSFNSATLIS